MIAKALAIVTPAILAVGLHFAGFWIWAGAHPWWSLSGALIGCAIAILCVSTIALMARRWNLSLGLIAACLAVIALIAIYMSLNGKEAFAASYASDAMAGRWWYYGYIASIAAMTATFATLSLRWVIKSRT